MYVSDGILVLLISFAIGSIPFGVLLAKAFRLPDPRAIGSGNIGATNMLRTGRKDVAALTLLLDASKGIAAVLLAYRLYDTVPAQAALALLAALIGHCYSPWLKFKGGKGVATALGGTLILSWPAGFGFCVAWLAIFLTTRLVSLASIVGLVIIPVIVYFYDERAALILALAATIAIWRHRTNIARLRDGTEPKL